MPPHIYQDAINLVVNLFARRGPSVFIYASMQTFLCGKVDYSNTFIITIFTQTLIPNR